MGRLVGIETIYGVDGEHRTPYMTRAWVGRLRLHVFHRGDNDPDPHDHPWDFWTFPITAYDEEVAERRIVGTLQDGSTYERPWYPHSDLMTWERVDVTISRNVVEPLRWHHRPAEYCHRVLGRVEQDYDFPSLWHPRPGRIVTIVWRGSGGRRWGFLKHRDGRWCWVHWKDYVFGGGKHAPCEPEGGS